MKIKYTILSVIEFISFLIIFSRFEKSKTKTVIKNIGIIIVCSIISYFTIQLKPISALLINYCSIMLMLMIVYKMRLMEVLIKILISYSVVLFIEFIIIILCSLINGYNFPKHDYKWLMIGNISLFFITTILFYFKYFDSFFDKIDEYIESICHGIKNIWVINTIIYSLIIKLMWDYLPEMILQNKFLILIIILLVYVINIYVYKHDNILNENKRIEEFYNKYSPLVSNITEDIRSKQHEFKNHINTIYGIVQVAEEDKLKEQLENYILSLNESLNKVEILKSNSSIVNAIIYSKIFEAKKNDIEFIYCINDIRKLPIKEYEMSELLSNLLNNAFEATNSEDKPLRRVQLSIWNSEDAFNIEIKNCCSKLKPMDINKIFKKGFSTKDKNRGYGLYNVKRIVNENKGEIFCSLEDNTIVFKIVFNNREL